MYAISLLVVPLEKINSSKSCLFFLHFVRQSDGVAQLEKAVTNR